MPLVRRLCVRLLTRRRHGSRLAGRRRPPPTPGKTPRGRTESVIHSVNQPAVRCRIDLFYPRRISQTAAARESVVVCSVSTRILRPPARRAGWWRRRFDHLPGRRCGRRAQARRITTTTPTGSLSVASPPRCVEYRVNSTINDGIDAVRPAYRRPTLLQIPAATHARAALSAAAAAATARRRNWWRTKRRRR
jgi:hypothetical protein